MKTKLNQERQETICKFIRAGNYYEVAAGCAGINKTTFYEWIKKGEAARSGIYTDFANAVKKAKDDAEAERVLKIRSIAVGDEPAQRTEIKDAETGKVTKVITKYAKPEWQAAAWLLERQHPERWAKRERVPVNDEGEEVPPVVVFNMPDNVVIKPPRNGDKPNDAIVQYGTAASNN